MSAKAARARVVSTDPVQGILSHVQSSKQALRRLHERWYYYVLFVSGEQWTYLDPDVGTIRPIPVAPWRQRITDNQTRGLLESMIALMLQRLPTWQATARGEEEEDRLAADGYEGLLQYDWDRLDLTQELETVLRWSLITGNGFWRVSWNPNAGKPIGTPMRVGDDVVAGKDRVRAEKGDAPEFHIAGEEQRSPTAFDEIVYEGDLGVETLFPFNVGVNLTAVDLKRCLHFHQEAYVHRDVLYDRIGKKAFDLTSDVSPGEYRAYQQSLAFDTGTASHYGSDDVVDMIRVIEFWNTADKRQPEGSVTTIAGNEILTPTEKGPYGGRLPFMHIVNNPVQGRFWGDGTVKDMVPLQKAHNSSLGRYHDIMMQSANPKWVADFGAGLKETSITDQTGEVIMKRRGYEVKPVPPPPPSPIHPAMIAITANALQSSTGINDPLAGANPPNVRAAATVRALQESGMRRFTPFALRSESFIKQAGRMVLYLHQRFWSDERTASVLGPDSNPIRIAMNKARIDRVQDVTLRHGSMMPRSDAAQAEMAIQTLQFAPFLYMDDQGRPDKEHIFRTLGQPSSRGRVGPGQIQRLRAFDEHLHAEDGDFDQIAVYPFDDDLMHIRLHGECLSSDAWRAAHPEGAGRLMEHLAKHEQQLMMKLQGGMVDPNQQQLPPSGPGGAGGPGGGGAAAPSPPQAPAQPGSSGGAP